MSFNITVEGGSSVRLPTKGKYCDRDIIITAEGGTKDLNEVLTEQEELIATLQETLKGKAAGTGDNSTLTALLQRTITEFSDSELTEIGGYAFYYCSDLASVHLPNLTTMGGYAFGGCTALTEVNFPLLKKVTSNGFRGCMALERADFGVATSIETNVFYNCQALTTLILRSPTVAYISSSGTVFNNAPIANGTGYIYVPSALVDEYKAATNWSVYADQFRAIEDYPDICGG